MATTNLLLLFCISKLLCTFVPMTTIKLAIENAIKQWNDECKRNNINNIYALDFTFRNKKYYINKIDFEEKEIAELCLKVSGEINYILWRKEFNVPKKVTNMSKVQLENHYRDYLYEFFVYECLGVFYVSTAEFIKNQDQAEYDFVNDRIKQHESAKDMVISALNEGKFYKIGDKFDVFMDTDEAYIVYTALPFARANNGVAKVDKKDFMIEREATKSIILLDDIK